MLLGIHVQTFEYATHVDEGEAAILPWPELWPSYFRSWLQGILKTKLGSVWSEMILVRKAF